MRILLSLMLFWVLILISVASYALECPAGQTVGYQFSYNSQTYNCSSFDSCASQHFDVSQPSPNPSVTSTGQAPSNVVTTTVTYSYAGLGSNSGSAGLIVYKVDKETDIKHSKFPEYNSNQTTQQDSGVSVSEVCVVDQCAAFEGDEVGGVKMPSDATQACVNSCLVTTDNPSGGKRVAVSFASEPQYKYTTAVHVGTSCTITPATPKPEVENDYIMEFVDGVPTFTQTGYKDIKLADTSDGTPGNIESQVAQLNPDVPLEVSDSNTSSGSDVSSGDIVPSSTVSNTINVTNVNNGNGVSGSYSISWNDSALAAGGTGGGSDGGTDGGSNGGTDGGSDGGADVDLSGVESRLDSINATLESFGDDVNFSADESSSKTFGQSTDDFMVGLSSAPIMTMMNNVDFGSAGGCAGFSASLPFGDVSTTLHCEVYESVSGILSAVMLFVFTFLGIRIILSA